MIQPDFKTFSRLAREGNLVPVYDTYTADLLTPVGAYLRIARGAKYAFLLESVEGGENIWRYTFTGANPDEVFRARGRVCELETGGKTVRFDENPVEQLKRLTARYRPVRVPGMPPLTAGAIGYFAYDMVRLVERIPNTGRDDLGVDDCMMMFYLGLVAFDRVQHRVWIIRNVFTEGPGSLRAKYNAAVREIARTRKLLEKPLPAQPHARRAKPLLVEFRFGFQTSDPLSLSRKDCLSGEHRLTSECSLEKLRSFLREGPGSLFHLPYRGFHAGPLTPGSAIFPGPHDSELT